MRVLAVVILVYVSNSLILPLNQSSGSPARALLRKSRLPLDGSVKEFGYYYTTVMIGQPPKPFDLIMDTGSSLTFVPCASCSQCGQHEDEPFDPSASSTANFVQCDSYDCACGGLCGCFHPSYMIGYDSIESQINQNNEWQGKCHYQRSYAEDSTSVGVLVQDVVQLAPTLTPSPATGPTPAPDTSLQSSTQQQLPNPVLTFGCELYESGQLKNQQADGILGLGNSLDAFHAQLALQGVFSSASFAYCLGGQEGGGVLLLGESPMPINQKNKTSLQKTSALVPFYKVDLVQIRVSGTSIYSSRGELQGDQGAILDSGTTFTYLPAAPRTQLVKLLDEQILKQQSVKKIYSQNYDCYKLPKDYQTVDLDTFFPVVEFEFGDDSILVSLAQQYMFKMSSRIFCLGIVEGDGGTLLGGITFRNILVHHDLDVDVVSFTSMECDQYNPCNEQNMNKSDPVTQQYCKLHKIQHPVSQTTTKWNWLIMLIVVGITLIVVSIAVIIFFKTTTCMRKFGSGLQYTEFEMGDVRRRSTGVRHSVRQQNQTTVI